jgi:hypothetical protein
MTELNMKSCSRHETLAGRGFATGRTAMEMNFEPAERKISADHQSGSASEIQ